MISAERKIKRMRFEGKTALVTGGGSGIGRAVCLALAEEGCDVVISYGHSEDGARETERLCREYGVKTLVCKCDVSSWPETEELFKSALELNGRVDVLVCNAGITRDNLLLRMKPEEFDEVQQTNLYGTFYCLKKAARIMLRQKYGRIVTISSIVALHGNEGQVNYAASKAGIIGMTKSLAKELARRNITCNAVAPGMVETAMTESLSPEVRDAMFRSIPAGRAATPEEIAHAVLFLADEKSGYITGQVLGVDGGMGC